MHFDLNKHLILVTIAGSRLYGTHTPDSDIDIKGICIPPSDIYYGFLKSFDQADAKDVIASACSRYLSEAEQLICQTQVLEGTIFEIRKFFYLFSQSNPNIFDVVFCDDIHVRYETPFGRLIREHRDLGISAKAKFTFSGYAHQQAERIRLHRRYLLNPPDHQPAREEYGLPNHTVIPQDHLNAAFAAVTKKMDEWELDLSCVPDETDRLNIMEKVQGSLKEILAGDGKWIRAGRAVNFDDNFLLLMEKERQFRSAQDAWSKYQNWKKTRNHARAELEAKYGFDTKHGSHLVRLTKMCREILLTGKVLVDRTHIDAEELKGIRRGAWSYDQLMEWFDREDAEINEIYSKKLYLVPHAPNLKKLDALCQRLVEEYLRDSSQEAADIIPIGGFPQPRA